MKTPMLFIGHGSPMNAIEDNSYTKEWINYVNKLGEVKTVIVFSAHYAKNSTVINSNTTNELERGFFGFPRQLHEVKYQSKPNLKLVSQLVDVLSCEIESVGLDHGVWTIFSKVFNEDVEVVQISLNLSLTPEEMFEIGARLKYLREQGIVYIFSGNIVHNLGKMSSIDNDFAIKFNDEVINNVVNKQVENVLKLSNSIYYKECHPSNEHLVPIYYLMGLLDEGDEVEVFNNKIEYSTLAMTSFYISNKI